ncbi:MAG: hypothetical protein PHQ40_02260 [Anaerolineaceae bacterium]|nr:hypothetical protein [Anaerolineaceae bacterium]
MQTANQKAKINLPHSAIIRAPGLLPMLYTVSELAQDLGLPDRTLRDWLASGAPHQRDSKNRIWIDGKTFYNWLDNQRKTKNTEKLTDDQAWCLRCKAPVKLWQPETRLIKGKLIHIRGTCPICGCTINRGGRLD